MDMVVQAGLAVLGEIGGDAQGGGGRQWAAVVVTAAAAAGSAVCLQLPSSARVCSSPNVCCSPVSHNSFVRCLVGVAGDGSSAFVPSASLRQGRNQQRHLRSLGAKSRLLDPRTGAELRSTAAAAGAGVATSRERSVAAVHSAGAAGAAARQRHRRACGRSRL